MRIQKRRHRERKTNYTKRIKLLSGAKPRILFRKTNKYIITQYITSKNAQDRVEISINSKEILKYGWPKDAQGSLKSTTASYFTGYLIAKKIIKDKKQIPVFDIGMIRKIHKTRAYAFLKGLIDAGLKIQYNEAKDIFPVEERTKGKHLKHKIDFEKIKLAMDKI